MYKFSGAGPMWEKGGHGQQHLAGAGDGEDHLAGAKDEWGNIAGAEQPLSLFEGRKWYKICQF